MEPLKGVIVMYDDRPVFIHQLSNTREEFTEESLKIAQENIGRKCGVHLQTYFSNLPHGEVKASIVLFYREDYSDIVEDLTKKKDVENIKQLKITMISLYEAQQIAVRMWNAGLKRDDRGFETIWAHLLTVNKLK